MDNRAQQAVPVEAVL